MSSFLRARAPLLACALILGLLVPSPTLAKEEVFPTHNCAFTPPDGWSLVTEGVESIPGLVALFRKPDQTSLLVLTATGEDSPDEGFDDRYVANFEKGIESTGVGKRISGRFIELAGVKAYERIGAHTREGTRISTLINVVPTIGKVYGVQAMRFDGDAGDAPELRQALATFRFLTPPKVPGSRSSAYEAGRTFGKAMAVLLPIAVLLIGAVVLVIWLVVRRKGRSAAGPPSMPPPL